MQRYYRDITMMRAHPTLNADRASETHGEVLLGLPPQAPIQRSRAPSARTRLARWAA